MEKVKSKLICLFFTLHFVLWTGVPCLRKILPLDTLEAIVWGAMKQWGTNKHPPLSGWLAYGVFQTHVGDIALYALSQMCVLAGLFFIFKIGKLFLSPTKALLATLLMEGILYYNFSSVEFNVNVVSLALWPATTYFFIKSVRQNKATDWLFFGFFAGLNILNKYVCGMLFLSMGLYLIGTKQGRAQFKSWGLYMAALVGLIMIFPHLVWLYNTDFFIIDYFLGRGSSVAYHPSNHLIYPVQFLITQLAFALPVLICYFWICRPAEKETQPMAKNDKLILLYTGLLPLLLTATVSLIGGIKLKSMWGFPLLYMTTIMLFALFPYRLKEPQIKNFIRCAFAFLFLFVIGYVAQIAGNAGKNFSTPPTRYLADINHLWQEEMGDKPLTTVGGGTWQTSALFVYHPTVKNVLYQMNFKSNPWFDKALMAQDGILIIDENTALIATYQKQYPTAVFREYTLETKNWFSKKRTKKIYYAIIPGEIQ